MLADETTLENRAISVWRKRRLLPRAAEKALLAATENLTLCATAALARLRERGDPHARLLAENNRLRIENAELRGECEILRSRIARIPPRERLHYSPEARFQIIEHMKRFLLTVEEAARRFLVTPQTVYNWLKELKRNPETKTIGTLLRAAPPIRRYGNVVRRLTRQMKAFGFTGCGHIAMSLALVGWSPHRRSVGRFLKEMISAPTFPDPANGKPRPTTVVGRYPNHLWLADITRIPTVFPFLYLHLAVIFDAFSRMPLQAAVSYFEPSAEAMLGLVHKAISIHGNPRHFVSDQGEQFTADLFKAALKSLGIHQRFGALYQHGSIALIERFFRTLKEDLHVAKQSSRPKKPWNLADFERRLVPALIRYSYCRPHSALGGRAPVEIFYGIPSQKPLTNLAPRGKREDPEIDCPFEIAFLDPDFETLPILVHKAA